MLRRRSTEPGLSEQAAGPVFLREGGAFFGTPGEVLTDLLYGMEEFQHRFGMALKNNEGFSANTEDKIFVSGAGEHARATALASYSNSIGQVVGAFTAAEIDSLIVVLNGPYGDLLKKTMTLDNAYVESRLAAYANETVAYGLIASEQNDSILFNKVFAYDLGEILDGKYINAIDSNCRVEVYDGGKEHTEFIGEGTSTFGISWLTNSTYVISTANGEPVESGY